MGFFRKRTRIGPVISTTVKSVDGHELNEKVSSQEMIKVLEAKLHDLEDRYDADRTTGPELAKRYATLSALYRQTGDGEKHMEYREKAIRIVKSDDYPGSEEAEEVEKFVRML